MVVYDRDLEDDPNSGDEHDLGPRRVSREEVGLSTLSASDKTSAATEPDIPAGGSQPQSE